MSSEGSPKGIDVKVLKRLLKYMDDAGLVELEIESEGMKVRLRKGGEPQAVYLPSQAVVAAPRPNGNSHPASETVPASGGGPANPNVMKSPMVGTFYRSPSPQSASFVNLGDEVAAGQILCVIEAMKLMNEIKAEKAGKIAAILAENGQPVEFDQPLFEISPIGEAPEAG